MPLDLKLEFLSDMLAKTMQRYQKPVAPVTVGYELEFALHPFVPGGKVGLAEVFFARLGFHKDYAYVYEMSSKPMALVWPPRIADALMLTVMEAVAVAMGWRVSHYNFPEDSRSCGSHIHFRSHSKRLMVRMHDWLAVISPLLAPLVTMGRYVECYEDGGCKLVEHRPKVVVFRPMFRHYVKPPRLIGIHHLEDAERTFGSFRGYDSGEDDNAFYLVELNKYRKDVVTVEYRANEQHPLAAYAVTMLAQHLASRYPPPLPDNMLRIYNYHPFWPAQVDNLVYNWPLLKEHPLFPKEEFTLLEFYEMLLETEPPEPARSLLEYVVSRKERVTLEEYARRWVEVLEGYNEGQVKDYVELAKTVLDAVRRRRA